MYGQMTAGSWIDIGTPGILQGTYETFALRRRKHLGGDLAGKLVVSGGMGAVGGAAASRGPRSTAARFWELTSDPNAIKRRVKSATAMLWFNDLDESLRILKNAVRKREAPPLDWLPLRGPDPRRSPSPGVVPDLLNRPDLRARSVKWLHPQGLDVRPQRNCASAILANTAAARSIPSPRTSAGCSTCKNSAR